MIRNALKVGRSADVCYVPLHYLIFSHIGCYAKGVGQNWHIIRYVLFECLLGISRFRKDLKFFFSFKVFFMAYFTFSVVFKSHWKWSRPCFFYRCNTAPPFSWKMLSGKDFALFWKRRGIRDLFFSFFRALRWKQK